MTIAKNGSIQCDTCGHFISFKDLAEGRASHTCVEPDSDRSRERYESECAKCKAKV